MATQVARLSKPAYNRFVDSEMKRYFIEDFGKEHGLDHYKTFSCKRKTVLLCVKEKGKVIGAVALRIERTSASLGAFVVGKGCRGKGIGSALVKECESIARKKGCAKLWLFAFPDGAAYKFYKKHGFIEEARLKRHFGPSDLCFMSKFI